MPGTVGGANGRQLRAGALLHACVEGSALVDRDMALDLLRGEVTAAHWGSAWFTQAVAEMALVGMVVPDFVLDAVVPGGVRGEAVPGGRAALVLEARLVDRYLATTVERPHVPVICQGHVRGGATGQEGEPNMAVRVELPRGNSSFLLVRRGALSP